MHITMVECSFKVVAGLLEGVSVMRSGQHTGSKVPSMDNAHAVSAQHE